MTPNPQLRLREDVWLFWGSSQPKELPSRWITQLTRSGVVCPGFPPPRPAPGAPVPAVAGTVGAPLPAAAPGAPRPANPLPPNPPRPAPGGILAGSSPSIHSTDLRISAPFFSQSAAEPMAPLAPASRSAEAGG